MQYKMIQTVNDTEEFSTEVNRHIDDGWQLYGDSIVIAVDSKAGMVPLYCQAVTRD